MFEAISEGLNSVFKRISGKGVLSEKDVDAALADIRRVLIDADAGIAPADSFIAAIRPQAVGTRVIGAIKPSDQILRIVHDGLVDMLGGSEPPPKLKIDSPPAVIMMLGLQGSGKTTSTVKLAAHLTKTRGMKVLVASLDPYRPAAMEQLSLLAGNAGIDALPAIEGQLPLDIARRAVNAAGLAGAEAVVLDTAGRVTVDERMMRELDDIADVANPSETLLVADAMTGQDAVTTASAFAERLRLTGIVLTRLDGDARGGAALSVRAVTGVPVRFVGVGEKIGDLDSFDPTRMAGRILGRADIVSLAEKAAQAQDTKDTKRMADRLRSGIFTLDDMMQQLATIDKMGGMEGVLNMLGGKAAAMRQRMNASGLDPESVHAYRAIACSMTRHERVRPKLLNASRKRRIAAGSGTEVARINKMLKMHRTMADAIRKGGPKALAGMAGGALPGAMR